MLLINVLSNLISLVGSFVGVFEIIVLPSNLKSVPCTRNRCETCYTTQVGEARDNYLCTTTCVRFLRCSCLQYHVHLIKGLKLKSIKYG